MTRLILCAAVLWLTGCAGANPCETRTDYQNVRETPPIRIPDALEDLPEEARLEIPVASTPPDVDTSCLEKPPRFSTGE